MTFFKVAFLHFKFAGEEKLLKPDDNLNFFSHSICGDKLPPIPWHQSIKSSLEGLCGLWRYVIHDPKLLPVSCDDPRIFYSLIRLSRWCHELISANSSVCKISPEVAGWFYSQAQKTSNDENYQKFVWLLPTNSQPEKICWKSSRKTSPFSPLLQPTVATSNKWTRKIFLLFLDQKNQPQRKPNELPSLSSQRQERSPGGSPIKFSTLIGHNCQVKIDIIVWRKIFQGWFFRRKLFLSHDKSFPPLQQHWLGQPQKIEWWRREKIEADSRTASGRCSKAIKGEIQDSVK